ncbi:hypothetical protein, partial [human papillomavirus 119]
QDNGLCIIAIQLLCPLPASSGGQQNPPKNHTPSPLPPGTPRPHRRNADDLLKRPLPLQHPHNRRLVFEIGDEEKENEPLPYQKEEDVPPSTPLNDLLCQLLHKLEVDIDSLRDRVWEDFNVFKQKLGIRPSLF